MSIPIRSTLIVCLFLFAGSCLSAESLGDYFSQLDQHLKDEKQLSAVELKKLEGAIANEASTLKDDHRLIEQALNLVNRYESSEGPLFLNTRTRGGYQRTKVDGIELDRVFFVIQQSLLDHSYHAENLKQAPELFRSKAFLTSEYFPGAVGASVDPDQFFESQINASQPADIGSPLTTQGKPARRPTGWYLPPGELAYIKMPKELADKGYSIRVGAHSWDLKKKPKVTRLDRVSLVYPVTDEVTEIAHPLGGGIYIEVPYEADAGVVKLYAKNVVESPFFSARFFDKTTLEEWQKVERVKKAPWTDFESDRFMMQVPTSWIYNYEDPVTLVAHYDKCMDLYSDLTGRERVRAKSVLYHQVDTVLRGGAFFPGYPQSNVNWNPLGKENGNKDHWMLKGPQHASHVLFHEMGHHERITKFRGETEAIVNFPFVAVHNIGYGVDLDVAYSQSLGVRNKRISLDQAAISWMVTQNFRDGKPMNITNRPGDQVKYQHRGYGKYVEIVKHFGWGAIQRFWKQDQLNYINGSPDFPKDVNKDPIDSRILRLSVAAGADLRPLIHFWGVQPVDNANLERQLREKRLEPSAKIYDAINRYKSVVPMTNDAFVKHAKIMFPNVMKATNHPNLSNPLFGQGWYYNHLDRYQTEHGEQAKAAIDRILETYFPQGRPRGG